jgi:site-specific DNA-methyltransferase (adenine-specific)
MKRLTHPAATPPRTAAGPSSTADAAAGAAEDATPDRAAHGAGSARVCAEAGADDTPLPAPLSADDVGLVHHGDNLPFLRALPDAIADLIYIDPPFNTGRTQARRELRTTRDDAGDRRGFQGARYKTETLGVRSFADRFDDYLGFLEPRLEEARRVLKPTGSLYFHIDYREVHYCKVLLDGIFGRACFLNEIIWAYDYGARPKRKWPAKHDNILLYVRDPDAYYFDEEAIDRIPYMAPGLVGPEKAARGKLPTDTWWHTIVSPTGKEKLGYPTQKPLGIVSRIVRASCPPGGLALDFFAGSGTLGEAARREGRRFILVDQSAEAIAVMQRRFGDAPGIRYSRAADA